MGRIIPYIMGKIKNVPNHQSDIIFVSQVMFRLPFLLMHRSHKQNPNMLVEHSASSIVSLLNIEMTSWLQSTPSSVHTLRCWLFCVFVRTCAKNSNSLTGEGWSNHYTDLGAITNKKQHENRRSLDNLDIIS